MPVLRFQKFVVDSRDLGPIALERKLDFENALGCWLNGLSVESYDAVKAYIRRHVATISKLASRVLLSTLRR